MATTAGGTYYAASSEAVSGYPAISLNLANQIESRLAAKADNSPTVNAQTGTTYTVATTDLGKTITCSNASPVTVTVNTGLSSLATGSIIRIINLGAGVVTVAPSGTTIAGSPLTLAQNKGASLLKTGTNAYVMLPFSGADRATYTATTGSPTVTTVSGKTCIKWTGSGSVTIGQGGLCEILVIGGAGAGGVGGGGGAGGHLATSTAYLPAGTHTVTVGAGGANLGAAQSGLAGTASALGPYFAAAGAGTSFTGANAAGLAGASGSGGRGSGVGGAGVTGLGKAGGTGGTDPTGGGGGGSTAVGSNGSGGTGGAGGAGTSSSIDGTPTTRAGGGGGGGTSSGGAGGSGGGGAGGTTTGTAGTANTGGGGGGANGTGTGGNGASGVVYLLIG